MDTLISRNVATPATSTDLSNELNHRRLAMTFVETYRTAWNKATTDAEKQDLWMKTSNRLDGLQDVVSSVASALLATKMAPAKGTEPWKQLRQLSRMSDSRGSRETTACVRLCALIGAHWTQAVVETYHLHLRGKKFLMLVWELCQKVPVWADAVRYLNVARILRHDAVLAQVRAAQNWQAIGYERLRGAAAHLEENASPIAIIDLKHATDLASGKMVRIGRWWVDDIEALTAYLHVWTVAAREQIIMSNGQAPASENNLLTFDDCGLLGPVTRDSAPRTPVRLEELIEWESLPRGNETERNTTRKRRRLNSSTERSSPPDTPTLVSMGSETRSHDDGADAVHRSRSFDSSVNVTRSEGEVTTPCPPGPRHPTVESHLTQDHASTEMADIDDESEQATRFRDFSVRNHTGLIIDKSPSPHSIVTSPSYEETDMSSSPTPVSGPSYVLRNACSSPDPDVAVPLLNDPGDPGFQQSPHSTISMISSKLSIDQRLTPSIRGEPAVLPVCTNGESLPYEVYQSDEDSTASVLDDQCEEPNEARGSKNTPVHCSTRRTLSPGYVTVSSPPHHEPLIRGSQPSASGESSLPDLETEYESDAESVPQSDDDAALQRDQSNNTSLQCPSSSEAETISAPNQTSVAFELLLPIDLKSSRESIFEDVRKAMLHSEIASIHQSPQHRHASEKSASIPVHCDAPDCALSTIAKADARIWCLSLAGLEKVLDDGEAVDRPVFVRGLRRNRSYNHDSQLKRAFRGRGPLRITVATL